MNDKTTTDGDAGITETSTSTDMAGIEQRLDRLDNLNKTLQGQLTEKERELERFKNINPDEYFALKDQDEIRRKEGLKGPEDIDALISDKVKEVESRFSSKIEQLENESQADKQRIKELRVDNVVKQKANGIIAKEYMDLVDPKISKYCDYKDGEIVILDDEGTVRRSQKDPRLLMTVEEYFDELINTYPRIAEDRNRRGTADSVGNGSTGKTYSGSGNMTVEQYMALGEQERQALPPEVRAKFNSEYFGTARPKRTTAGDMLNS